MKKIIFVFALLCVLQSYSQSPSEKTVNEQRYNRYVDNYSNKQTYYYQHSNLAPLTLGYGFDPDLIESPKQSPIQFKTEPISNGSFSTQFSFELIRSKSELMSSLDFDQKINVRYLFASGDLKLSISEKTEFSSSNIVLMMKGSVEFPAVRLTNINALPEAKSLYKKCKKEENFRPFKDKYGTRIPLVQRRGCSIYLVMQIHDESSSLRRLLSIEMNGSADMGVISASVYSSIRSELQKKFQNGQVKFEVISNGGDGFAGIDGIIESIKDNGTTYEEVKKSFAKLLLKYTAANSSPVGYFCTNISELYPLFEEIQTVESEEKELALKNIINEYRHYDKLIQRLNYIMAINSPFYNLLTDDQKQKVSRFIAALIRHQLDLKIAHQRILNGSTNYNIPRLDAISFNLPEELGICFSSLQLRAGGDPTQLADYLAILPTSSIQQFNLPASPFIYNIQTPFLKTVSFELKEIDYGEPSNGQIIQKHQVLVGPQNAVPQVGEVGVQFPNIYVFQNGYCQIPKARIQSFLESKIIDPSPEPYGTTFKIIMKVTNAFDLEKEVEIGYLFHYAPNNFSYVFYPLNCNSSMTVGMGSLLFASQSGTIARGAAATTTAYIYSVLEPTERNQNVVYMSTGTSIIFTDAADYNRQLQSKEKEFIKKCGYPSNYNVRSSIAFPDAASRDADRRDVKENWENSTNSEGKKYVVKDISVEQ